MIDSLVRVNAGWTSDDTFRFAITSHGAASPLLKIHHSRHITIAISQTIIGTHTAVIELCRGRSSSMIHLNCLSNWSDHKNISSWLRSRRLAHDWTRPISRAITVVWIDGTNITRGRTSSRHPTAAAHHARRWSIPAPSTSPAWRRWLSSETSPGAVSASQRTMATPWWAIASTGWTVRPPPSWWITI